MIPRFVYIKKFPSHSMSLGFFLSVVFFFLSSLRDFFFFWIMTLSLTVEGFRDKSLQNPVVLFSTRDEKGARMVNTQMRDVVGSESRFALCWLFRLSLSPSLSLPSYSNYVCLVWKVISIFLSNGSSVSLHCMRLVIRVIEMLFIIVVG